ncbi:hypothetical protein SDC9_108529 [bioreactor metagenome]|uniref:Uncharacterized protein n=1 Tax=bioreactor metagenome TaxID=1076179 RepID=A0A645B869_9ZZZZ
MGNGLIQPGFVSLVIAHQVIKPLVTGLMGGGGFQNGKSAQAVDTGIRIEQGLVDAGNAGILNTVGAIHRGANNVKFGIGVRGKAF